MTENKVILFGPVGSGKSTAIRSVCGSDSIHTDTSTSDSSRLRKRNTTVAMDYGVVEAHQQRIHLYGTPGQERFRFMWEMVTTELAHNCSGMILLLDNARQHPRRDLEFFLDNFLRDRPHPSLIIGVTRSDLCDTPRQSDYAGWLAELEIRAPVYFIDARNPADVLFLIEELVAPVRATHNNHSLVNDELLAPEEVFSCAEQQPVFSPALLQDIERIAAVKGMVLLNSNAEAEYSSLSQARQNELCHITQGIIPLLGKIDAGEALEMITLDTDSGGFYGVMIADNRLLAIHCRDQISPLMLKQEIDNLLQWQNDPQLLQTNT